MSSVLRPGRKRKKGRKLSPVEFIRRQEYADPDLDAKAELIRSLVPLGLLHVQDTRPGGDGAGRRFRVEIKPVKAGPATGSDC